MEHLEHPIEEALERFLLHQSEGPEIELVETHILACEPCVDKLEALEIQIAATKIALAELRDSRAKQAARDKRSWKAWFGIGGVSFAGAAACAVLAIAAFTPAQVQLSAYRGTEASFVPEWRPLHIHLQTADLPDGSMAAQVVDNEGVEVWRGATAIVHEQADVHVPRLTKAGNYFLRLYAPAKGSAEGDLLREFPFRVN